MGRIYPEKTRFYVDSTGVEIELEELNKFYYQVVESKKRIYHEVAADGRKKTRLRHEKRVIILGKKENLFEGRGGKRQ